MKKYILFIAFIFASCTVVGQSPESKQKQYDKKKEVKQQNMQKESVKARERHMKIQEKEVRKRMKKSLKEAKRHNASKGKPFFIRWFSKKHHN